MTTVTLSLRTWLVSLPTSTNRSLSFRCPVRPFHIRCVPVVKLTSLSVNAVRLQKMMQAMGVPPTGSVAIGVAQRSVLQNPGGATANLGGAATQRRGLTRSEFRKEVARQIQQGSTTSTTTTNNNANPVAAQLLLAPTFVPVQANAVLDQANMRIAVPVRQVDGEYILTMQVMGGNAQAAQPAQGQTPTAASPAAQASPKAAGAAPAGASPAAAEGQKPSLEGQAPVSNGTATARPERRADDSKDQYGNPKPPQGAVIMTMKDIDTMANAMTWGGQAAITKIMSDYVKEQTGKGIDPITKGAADQSATAKLTVA